MLICLSAGASRPVEKALPIVLDTGWQAADADPPDGVLGLDRLTFRPADPAHDQAPRNAVRWYRIELDLSAYREVALAFSVPGLRDVDETFFDRVKIGGAGAFPPKVDRANLIPRVYPIPNYLFQSPGAKTLAVRVYHGRRDGTVFRTAAVVDSLAVIQRARSRLDELLSLFAGTVLTIAIVFFLFAFHARGSREFPLFAAFALLLGVYAFTLHSGWSAWDVSRELPFRLGSAASALVGAFYLPAVCGLIRAEVPRRFGLYALWFGGFAVFVAAVPDTELAVVPSRIHRFVFIVALLDLFLPIVRELGVKRLRIVTVAAGHTVLLIGALLLAEVPFGFFRDSTRWAFFFLGGGFCLLTATFLWAMSEQMTRFRVAALTDPGTRLWNREALFEEIRGRIDSPPRAEGQTFGLIIIDLDHFKEWNDTRGHLAGDRLLLRVARALQDASRPRDLVARYGGDEFAVVLEDVDTSTAESVAARFHQAVESAVQAESPGAAVTSSIGVAVYSPARHGNPSSLFQDADRALYDAKAAGRNRVVVHIPRPPSDAHRRASGERGRKSSSAGEGLRPPTGPLP